MTIEAAPSAENKLLRIWQWKFPGAPIDSVMTDGKVLEFHSTDGLWRRSVIGVKALAQHLDVLAGTMDAERAKKRSQDNRNTE